jgi:predicted unusual protein kinase regulating ubiquinone biosynthesis (AarF/ABC1/UbiB family)
MSQVEVLARELGALKGSVMKVGQVLSIYGEQFLPEEVNAVLKTLQNQSPPLAWDSVRPVIERELGREKFMALEIEKEAVASASLGQVHRARIRGESPLASRVPEFAREMDLAMKIQYPGVDRSIDSDLSSLRRILSVSKLLPRAEGYAELFSEVREMLHQEVDYGQELLATEAFRARLENDPRFVVPRVVRELSTPRLITTEYVPGCPVDSPEVAALSQERRNALAFAMLELLFLELYSYGEVQTDPHFGNYRIQIGSGEGGDRIVLLDFGAVRKLPEAFTGPYFELHRGTFEGDHALIEHAAIGMGFFESHDSPELKRSFSELCLLLAEPFRGTYDWGASDLPVRAARAGAEVALAFKLRPPPREVVFVDRKLGGVFVFLSTLKAKIDAKSLLGRYLAKTAGS